MEGNVMVQDGHQNMWTQYSGNFTIRNNIFIHGRIGINSTMHSYVYHNVFFKSGLRYDAHLTNNRPLATITSRRTCALKTT